MSPVEPLVLEALQLPRQLGGLRWKLSGSSGWPLPKLLQASTSFVPYSYYFMPEPPYNALLQELKHPAERWILSG
jgi:hypothetical protein